MHTYSCPIHPDVRSDKPLTCPKCGIKLQQLEIEPRTKTSRAGKQQPIRER